MKTTVSILISSYNRLPLLRRTLWSIANRPPSQPFEVVLADDGSTDNILSELCKYSSCFPWKLILCDMEKFTQETGIRKFLNNPSWTNNVAARHAQGDLLFLQGNEVIAVGDVYDRLIAESPPPSENFVSFSTTLDVPQEALDYLDVYGSNLDNRVITYCSRWPLATPYFHTDVTNYLCLTSRTLWETLGGYNEEYVGGLGKEDSDFIRRCRAIPGWLDATHMVRSMALSLHQYHGGRTCHYLQKDEVCTAARWKEGEALSRAIWDRWDGTCRNPQTWPWGTIGVVDVISNV